MIVEAFVIGTGIYLYSNFNKIIIKKRWKDICFSNNKFTNNLGKTIRIWDIKKTQYGNVIKAELPYSYTISDLEKDIDIFREGLHYDSIQVKKHDNIVNLYCIKNYIYKDYEAIKTGPSKILIGDGIIKPIVVDMNKFPHVLIGGDTGTGKSRILLLILTNLIKYCDNVDIHLLQIRKNDLGVFNMCSQVKTNSKTLDQVLEALKGIDKECKRREKIIDNTKGYYNIDDYNTKSYYKLKYIYVVVEEFSFLNISRGDTREEKRLKAQCLKYIKTIVNVGRSSGVFLITALQKPTNDSIPSDIKAQLCTRISLKIADEPAAIVILGNGKATKLQEREIICRTLNEEKGYSYTINHEKIIENIKHRFTQKKKVAPIKDNKINNDVNNILKMLDEINK